MEEKQSQEIAMLRITLIGARESGKTTLANVFVNNIFYGNYDPTERLTLYHKYVHRPAKIHVKSGRQSEPDTFILLEIEDTYGCDRPKSRQHDLHCKDTIYNPWFPQEPDDLENDMKRHFNEARSTKDSKEGAKGSFREDFKVLDGRRNFDAPLGLSELSSSAQEYRPLTKNRMAYFFVFDVNSEDSFKEAQKEYAEQRAYLERKRIPLQILSYGVATKIDIKTPESDKVWIDAKRWASKNGIALVQVSAAKRQNVDELFDNACERVHGTTALWVFQNVHGHGDDGVEGKKNGQDGCCIH